MRSEFTVYDRGNERRQRTLTAKNVIKQRTVLKTIDAAVAVVRNFLKC